MSPDPGRHREAAAPSRGPATPTWPACRSTASATPATSSSGPPPGRPRPGSRPGPSPRLLLAELGIEIVSHVVQMGPVGSEIGLRPAGPADLAAVDASEVRCFDAEAEEAMIAEIKAAAKVGDSLGGVAEVIAYGVPVGLGSHVHWDRKLDGLLAQASCQHPGRQGGRDRRRYRGRRPARFGGARPDRMGRRSSRHYVRESNWSGGIEGGMTQRRADRGPGGHEAPRHAEPAGAEDGRRGDQGGDGLVQGADRRDRGAGHGRGRRDDDGAGAGRRGAAQVRRRLRRRGASATTTPTSRLSRCADAPRDRRAGPREP